jgi:hypothetical protein
MKEPAHRGANMTRRTHIFALLVAMCCGGFAPQPGNAADLIKLPRALYWNLRASLQSPPIAVKTLQSLVVSEAHIWLNDVRMGTDELAHCAPFSSTDSD